MRSLLSKPAPARRDLPSSILHLPSLTSAAPRSVHPACQRSAGSGLGCSWYPRSGSSGRRRCCCCCFRWPSATTPHAPGHFSPPVRRSTRPAPGAKSCDGTLRTVDEMPYSVSGIPRTVDEMPRSVSGMPRTVDEKPRSVSGMPKTVDEKPRSVSGMPRTVDGKPHSVSEIRSTGAP